MPIQKKDMMGANFLKKAEEQRRKKREAKATTKPKKKPARSEGLVLRDEEEEENIKILTPAQPSSLPITPLTTSIFYPPILEHSAPPNLDITVPDIAARNAVEVHNLEVHMVDYAVNEETPLSKRRKRPKQRLWKKQLNLATEEYKKVSGEALITSSKIVQLKKEKVELETAKQTTEQERDELRHEM
ncbi:hypothetical protein JCGZ_16926 [Jatropha curcas]|uniref:Uncharacterized protein n=1 Tax=Jatropha curcas TaxID=180498 RepID=A0A067K352_JATCU|nr:hypothetical protein JCGZ_16926 [Jatropha curcas]